MKVLTAGNCEVCGEFGFANFAGVDDDTKFYCADCYEQYETYVPERELGGEG